MTVEVVFGYMQVGAYSVVVWDKSGKAKKKIGEGVNTDQVQDLYTLPPPVSGYEGRILDCMATILGASPGLGERYRVDVIMRQDGVQCGVLSEEGQVGSSSVSIRLAARFVC
jgi:hypothetical protein